MGLFSTIIGISMKKNSGARRIKYYQSFDQDFAESHNQDFCLPENYDWIGGFGRKFGGFLLYPIVLLIDLIYMKCVAHISVRNRKVLRKTKSGYFVYANHTLTFGDVVDPFMICWPKRPHIVCSAANLGIVAIGGWLPAAGALPLPEDLRGMKKFANAIEKRIGQKRPVVIYPESHMWPYFTEIRPFTSGSFHYPAALGAPIYTATTTFTKSRIFKRPKINIYVDGPFVADHDLSRKEQQNQLAQKAREAMERRAQSSDYSYITYRQKS